MQSWANTLPCQQAHRPAGKWNQTVEETCILQLVSVTEFNVTFSVYFKLVGKSFLKFWSKNLYRWSRNCVSSGGTFYFQPPSMYVCTVVQKLLGISSPNLADGYSSWQVLVMHFIWGQKVKSNQIKSKAIWGQNVKCQGRREFALFWVPILLLDLFLDLSAKVTASNKYNAATAAASHKHSPEGAAMDVILQSH